MGNDNAARAKRSLAELRERIAVAHVVDAFRAIAVLDRKADAIQRDAGAPPGTGEAFHHHQHGTGIIRYQLCTHLARCLPGQHGLLAVGQDQVGGVAEQIRATQGQDARQPGPLFRRGQSRQLVAFPPQGQLQFPVVELAALPRQMRLDPQLACLHHRGPVPHVDHIHHTENQTQSHGGQAVDAPEEESVG